ncbi:hypothetical protein [Novosphingobium sp. BW1]|nr:hypothetical protein [Novosphingobium sp. BW1]
MRSATQRMGAAIHVKARTPGLRVTIAFSGSRDAMPSAHSAQGT